MVMDGPVLPHLTVILKLQVTSVPSVSVALQLTTVSPSGKKLPEGGSQTTSMSAGQRRWAVARKETFAPPGALQVTSMSLGQSIWSGVGSTTTNCTMQKPMFPFASGVLRTIGCVPGPTGVPGAGLC